MADRLLFLPGASGNTTFWQPLANLLAHPGERLHLGWPGFGPTPPDATISGIDDLVALVLTRIDRPTTLLAQSMGGVIALLAALARPQLVTRLVLTATSGGLNLNDLGAEDWRPAFCAANPSLPRWFADYRVDLSGKLGTITAPTLLLWGDADPLSPVQVGERLAQLLPNATLHVLAGGNHDLGCTRARQIAPLVERHLNSLRERPH